MVRLWTVPLVLLVGCGVGPRGGGDNGLSLPEELAYSDAGRFEELLGMVVTVDATSVQELPEQSEENVILSLEAIVGVPDRDPVLGGYPIDPPANWTIGVNEEGEEVRVEFLEPEGGQVVMTCEPEVELSSESNSTWIVRYERRNVRLTEVGMDMAIHVTPVAVRIEPPDMDPMFWISSEAPQAEPE